MWGWNVNILWVSTQNIIPLDLFILFQSLSRRSALPCAILFLSLALTGRLSRKCLASAIELYG